MCMSTFLCKAIDYFQNRVLYAINNSLNQYTTSAIFVGFSGLLHIIKSLVLINIAGISNASYKHNMVIIRTFVFVTY